MKYIDDLAWWVQERERVRVKRLMGHPPPWTKDEIIANNRFCNIERENDKVTRFIHNEWLYKRNSQHYPIAFAIARLVNWPDTLGMLGYPLFGWDKDYRDNWFATFDGLRQHGQKAWTGAYMVTGGYSKGGETKETIIARVIDGLWIGAQYWDKDKVTTLKDAWEFLQVPGIGSFLAAQIVADLKNTSWLMDAPDWETWCAPGPGSMMGLNFIFDRPRTHQVSLPQFQLEVLEIKDIIEQRTGHYLCAQNTQNCLCELSKYIRAKYFNERLKNTYHAQRDIGNQRVQG